MNKKITVFISISLVLVNILGIIFLNSPTSANTLVANKGKLNTENWNYQSGIIKLTGEWEFYPDRLIYPESNEDVFKKFTHDVRYVQVPGDWYKYESVNRPKKNIGTYRLIIDLPYDANFGIKTTAMSYSYTVFINGIKVCDSGRTSENVEEYLPDNLNKIGIGASKNRTLELVVHISNYEAQLGGILQPLYLGTEKQLMVDKDRSKILDALLVSGYLILGLYFAGCFMQRKKTKFLLYFSLFTILLGIYTSTVNERLIELIIPMPENLMTFYNFQIHVMYIAIFFFLLFVYDFFKEYVSKKFVVFLSILLLIVGPIFLWIPYDSIYNMGLSIYAHQIIIVSIVGLNYLYMLLCMLRAVYHGAESSGFILVIVVSLSCYISVLCLEFLIKLNIGRLPLIIFFIMLLTISFMTTYRFQLAYEKTDRLTDQLLSYDRLKDKFMNKISMEYLKPLQNILMISENLLSDNHLNGLQKQKILRINSESRQISHMVEELSEMTDIQEDVNCMIEEVALDQIIDMVEELKYLAMDKEQIQIKNEIPKKLPPVLADKVKLKRIFYHLISNGVKYTEEGSVTISAEVGDNMAYFFVKDTGIGIDKSKWDHIFNSFYQGNPYDDNATGLGLGLSIASNLIKLHKGKVWVTSELGKGSKFTFTLPLYPDENRATKCNQKLDKVEDEEEVLSSRTVSRKEPSNRVNGSIADNKVNIYYTILLISNSEPEQKFFFHLLNNMGYGVIFSADKEETFRLLETNKVDTVILKSEVNGISAMELCKGIRKNHGLADLPILVLAEAGVNEAQIYLGSGANDYLKKPYETEELKARIKMLIMVKNSATESLNQELNNLQAQIMPHFLYNTLNTIIGLSFKDKEKTFDALQNLSTYFRAKLDFKGYQSFVTLEREVELLKAYLSIEQIRYGERLEIEYDIDASIVILLPSLTLQPLVENAVKHSIGAVDNVKIFIKIYREKGTIVIHIKDNGPGISKMKQEELLSGKNHRIGFTNVMRRVKLMKGSRLVIESLENRGTSITITLLEGTK